MIFTRFKESMATNRPLAIKRTWVVKSKQVGDTLVAIKGIFVATKG